MALEPQFVLKHVAKLAFHDDILCGLDLEGRLTMLHLGLSQIFDLIIGHF